MESDDAYPPAEYWSVLDAALDVWLDGEIPGDLVHVSRAVDRLAEVYDAFNQSGAALPPRSFWTAREEVEFSRRQESPRLAPLPLPAELAKQGVTPRQIARIWKLLDERDVPRVDLVQQELDAPGSVITADYITQVDRRRMAEAGFGQPSLSRERPRVEPPEQQLSLEDLIRQRLSLDQIVRLKGQQYGTDFPAPVVLLLARAMGVELSASAADVLNLAGAADIAKRDGEAAAKVPFNTVSVLEPRELSTEPPTDLGFDAADVPVEDQVAELFAAGHDARTISQHTGLPKKKVEQIIRESQG